MSNICAPGRVPSALCPQTSAFVMTLSADIENYITYVKTNFERNIPITEAQLVQNTLLYAIAAGGISSGSGGSGATAANQAEVITRLNTLLSENATEAEQQDIEAAITALQNAWLAENATEAKQDAIIAKNEQVRSLIESVKNAIAPVATKATPSLSIVNNAGTTPISNTIANAKHIGIVVKQGSGTVDGAVVDTTIGEVNYPFLERGWNDLSYTVDPGSIFVILTGS